MRTKRIAIRWGRLLLAISLVTSIVLSGCAVDEASFANVQFIDETGTPYGIKQVDNKPRISSMPFTYDIAEGNVPNHFPLDKFGRNTNIGTTIEEIWEGNVPYPYLSSAEVLQVSSSDIDDQGLVRSSGNATGGTTTTLIDTSATFLSDVVAIGDIVLNDSLLDRESTADTIAHGVVESLTETEITFAQSMTSSSLSGDAYRIVNANDTGAAVIQIGGLDANYNEIANYIVMNTGASVASSSSFLRIYRAVVRLAGSSDTNEGTISIKDNADSVTLALISPLLGQTLMATWTVPAGFTLFVTNYSASEVKAKEMQIILMVKPQGESWQIKHSTDVKSDQFQHIFTSPKKVLEKSDIAIKGAATGASGKGSAGFAGWYETK